MTSKVLPFEVIDHNSEIHHKEIYKLRNYFLHDEYTIKTFEN